MDKTALVTIGVNLVVVKQGKLLLGRRKNIVGSGTWGLPGGRLDEGEWIYEAAKRELKEETGLDAEVFSLITVVHQIQKGNEHWLQFGFEVDTFTGKVTLKEPDVCEEWRWFKWENLPKPIFPAHIKPIEQWQHYTHMLSEEELRL